jgi:hypothetical protein
MGIDGLIKDGKVIANTRTNLVRSGIGVKGELELGVVVITQILTTSGVELVGPFPPEIQ